MAEQSLCAKLGLRLAIVGSAASLAIAAPILNAGSQDTTAHTAANRTGIYFDQTAAAEKIGFMCGGQTGPILTRSGTNVNISIGSTAAGTDFATGNAVQLAGSIGIDAASTATTAVTNAGLYARITHTPASASSASVYAINAAITIAGSQNTNSDHTINALLTKSSTGTATNLNVVRAQADVSAASGTTADVRAFNAVMGNSGAGIITALYGVRASTATNTGGGTIGTVTGVHVSAQTVGAVNYAINCAGAGIVNIADTTASTSSTTGALLVAGGCGIGLNLFVQGNVGSVGRVFSSAAITTGIGTGNVGFWRSGGTIGTAGDMIIQSDLASNRSFLFRAGTTTPVSVAEITGLGSIVPWNAALATNATDGFVYMASCAGTPTGVPTAFTGRVAFCYDSTNNIIYIYNGAWKKTVALT